MTLKLCSCSNLHKLLHRQLTNHFLIRQTASRAPQAVLLEKHLEHPVIVVAEDDDVDIIGPPDRLSNLRPIIRKQHFNESALQQKLRVMQDETQAWNQDFWAKHNAKFINERQIYVDKFQLDGQDKVQLTADEMSEFYKKFLDDNWESHVKYNFEWYKRNFKLLVLAFSVSVEKHLGKLR